MIYRLWYFIRETVVSLWRNLSLTLAAILTLPCGDLAAG